MQSTIPKQFLKLGDEAIIVSTIKKFLEADGDIHLIVVIPRAHEDYWRTIASEYPDMKAVQVAFGGTTRTASVMSGLSCIDAPQGLVAIHDAVRPFVSPAIINKSFDCALAKGSGVVAVSLKDSLRKRDGNKSVAVDRSEFVAVQTPQTFLLSNIRNAYDRLENGQSFSDDATVLESAGFEVHLVEGSYANKKITTPEDLMD